MKYNITQSRLLYVYSIDDRKHKGLLKVGEVFVDNDVVSADMSQLMRAVRGVLERRSYMQGITYHIDYVECTTYNDISCYKADDIHQCLKNSGVDCEYLNKYNKEQADVWFRCEVDIVCRAIRAVKEGKKTFNDTDHLVPPTKIVFRPEQEDAISRTVKKLSNKTDNNFLWNAKMRFGKTTCGLEVARRMGVSTTLIVTHRPVVDAGWHDDFHKIFGDVEDTYVYATRTEDAEEGGNFNDLIKKVERGEKKLIFFVSLQYLRLSELVGGKNTEKLKRTIMQYPWDLVMIDEAHEGTESTMGKRVIEQLKKPETKVLSLSGTPFNLLDQYNEDEIYTWDYVMEQEAKREWDDRHFGDPNPYAVLPRMQILTFTLSQMLRKKLGDGNSFKFHEFFRTWTGDPKLDGRPMPSSDLKGRFIYESAVREFLNRLTATSDTSLYPFSRKEFRANFAHTLWLLPYVKEAAAMEALLADHRVFKNFKIVNVAGDGNIEDTNGSALREVQKAIKENRRTITLSCGKLTTGVSVPEWTAVLCMKGSENTPAANYMQTIFRVQTHAVLSGCQKSDCYVFDFAPDRALTAVAETSKMQQQAVGGKKGKAYKGTQEDEERHLTSFLQLCPVISMDGATMGKHFSANQLFEKLKNVYVERAVRSGYADNSLYNHEALLELTPDQESTLDDVSGIVGKSTAAWKPSQIEVNHQGFDGTKDADDVQYVFYLTDLSGVSRPIAAHDLRFENGAPMPTDNDWVVKMPSVSEGMPYLYSSFSTKKEGKWSTYSEPVLWREWKAPKADNKTEEQKERDKKNAEKRARMSVLRGVSIRIPLLVYGAEIDDENGEEITIDNFTDLVDATSWEEYMPTGFTKKMFNKLKDCFDRSIFTGAAKRIRQMVKEADTLSTEDRINRIATIFSFFHNPDKETVLTPWRVVNRHLSDTLGGWCFYNDRFDDYYQEENEYGEPVNAVRFVDGGKATEEVFGDYNTRILEINSKTGLYPLYIAYSIFRSAKEKVWRGIGLTGERGVYHNAEEYDEQVKDDQEIWEDVLQDNIFVVCRTKMAASITRRTLAGFRDVKMNVKCYERKVPVTALVNAGVLKRDLFGLSKNGRDYLLNDKADLSCDMTDVLRAAPELFLQDVVQGKKFWKVYSSLPLKENEDINNMKFTAVVGNPPYQLKTEDTSDTPIYHLFMEAAEQLSDIYSVITPARFLFNAGKTPKEFNNKVLNDKHFKVAYYTPNSTDIFPKVDIKGGVAISMRNAKEDFGKIYSFTAFEELKQILNKVVSKDGFQSIDSLIILQNKFNLEALYKDYPHYRQIIGSGGKEKRLTTSIFNTIDAFTIQKVNDDDACIIGLINNNRMYRYIPQRYLDNHENLNKYKVILPKSNGSGALGEVLSTPLIGEPLIGYTQSFIGIGAFDSNQEAETTYKYVKSKFARVMLGVLKVTQDNNTDVWKYVPLQDFTSASDIDWSKSVAEIDQQLYKKYGLNEEEIAFIERMIKPME